jgi:hypothetical protein
MSRLKSFKVVWKDETGAVRERVYGIDLDKAGRTAVKQAGVRMAKHSRFGFDSLVWVVPCWFCGTCRLPELRIE